MGNFYNWHDERMNELKMQEINREIEHLHLLKEVGLSSPGLLSRVASALRNRLQAHSQQQEQGCSTESPSYTTMD